MPDSISEFCNTRGGLGLLILLDSEAQRFTDLSEFLHISESTLTIRLKQARDLGLVTPEIDESGTSVDDQYRITERGAFIVKKAGELDMVHAYRTMLDMYHKVEDGREDLNHWLDTEQVMRRLARCDDKDPYVDAFGEDVTGYEEEVPEELDDEFFTRE